MPEPEEPLSAAQLAANAENIRRTMRQAPPVPVHLPRTFVRYTQNRTTAPKPAPPATSALPHNNRPRTAGLWLCEECGQSWDITPAGGSFVAGDAAVPRYCPTCGSATLTRTLSTFNGLECGAIKTLRVERLLAQLLYEHWAANLHAEQAKYPRYVDYLRAQLSGVE